MIYTYFVSFVWQAKNGNHGFSDCATKVKAPLSTFDDIQKLRETIRKENHYESVTILYFTLMNMKVDHG